MSSVIISGDVSGSITLQAPSAAGSTVLTLPATSGTLAIGGTTPTFTSLTVSSTTGAETITSTTTGNAAYLLLNNSADSSNAYVYATGKELRLSQADTSASSIVTMYTQNTERMRVGSNGSVAIGNTTTGGYGEKLMIASASGTQSSLMLLNPGTGSGQIGISAASTNFKIYNTYSTGTLAGGVGIDIDSSGNVLVGTTTAGSSTPKFRSVGGSWAGEFVNNNAVLCTATGTSGFAAYFQTSNTTAAGYIFTNGATTSYSTSSDYRLKENVEPMVGALEKISALKPVTYTWKADGSAGQGFIAHELQAVIPDCVVGEKDAIDEEGKPVYQGIDPSKLVATLTAAIQELNAKVTALEAQLGAK